MFFSYLKRRCGHAHRHDRTSVTVSGLPRAATVPRKDREAGIKGSWTLR